MRNGLVSASLALATMILAGSPVAHAADPCQGKDLCSTAGCSDLCFFDSKEDGTGVQVAWETLPIKYKLNLSKLPNGVTKQQAETAIKAAFSNWENLPCSNLAFTYAGESTSTTEEEGHILVYFGKDGATWIHGASAYYYTLSFLTVKKGDINKGVIGMNAKDYEWSIGAKTNAIDIESAVTWMIPGVVGFYIGNNAATGSLPIYYNTVNTTLCQSHKDGAAMAYPSGAAGCATPTAVACATGAPPTDGGTQPTTDGGTQPSGDSGTQPSGDSGTQPGGDSGTQPSGDSGTSSGDGGTSSGDSGTALPPSDDDGCCRVGHARASNIPVLTLMGLGLLLLLGRRRRRR